jgi:stage II sporulation protein M
MLKRLNETIRRHLSDNMISYAVIMFFFILGISLGALTVSNINIDIKSNVKAYIDGFVSISQTEPIHSVEILKQSIKLNLFTTAALFLAGLTYAGIILIPLIAGFRGFCVGFTIAFLADSLGKGGFLLALVSVLPQNLIYLPVLIVFCVCSISLAFMVLKSKLNHKSSELQNYLASFAMTALFLFFITMGGSILEAYMAPVLVKLVAPYIL